MKWTDTREIAIALADAHPDVDPLTVRFTDLHQWVCALPGFADDPALAHDDLLSGILREWYEETCEAS